MSYQAIITQAGLNRAVEASQQGVAFKITHIGAGTSGYTPATAATALVSEVVRIPVSGGRDVGETQIHLTGLFDTGEFACRELGFYLEDGTLFAIWSHPSNVLFYKTAMNSVVQGFDLSLSAVPPNSITVNSTGDLNIMLSPELAKMATAQIASMNRYLKQKFALMKAYLI